MPTKMIIVREIITIIGEEMWRNWKLHTVKGTDALEGSLTVPQKVKHVTQESYFLVHVPGK